MGQRPDDPRVPASAGHAETDGPRRGVATPLAGARSWPGDPTDLGLARSLSRPGSARQASRAQGAEAGQGERHPGGGLTFSRDRVPRSAYATDATASTPAPRVQTVRMATALPCAHTATVPA